MILVSHKKHNNSDGAADRIGGYSRAAMAFASDLDFCASLRPSSDSQLSALRSQLSAQ